MSDYSITVCAKCRTQCDPDGHWGCAAKGWGDGDPADHGLLIAIPVPTEIVTAALASKQGPTDA